MFDGIDINAPAAIVQIENVRIENLYGSYATMHADAVQTWGGVQDLRIDHLSVDGDYQGLTIDPDLGPVGSAEIQNVDLTIDPVPSSLASISAGRRAHDLAHQRGDDMRRAFVCQLRERLYRRFGV